MEYKIGKNEVDEKDETFFLIVITIVTLFASLYGKFLTFGWTTIIFFFLFLADYILFTVCGIKFAKAKNKTKKDYKYFAALCITLILYSFTFRDFGDQPIKITNKIIAFMVEIEEILSAISFISFISNIVLSFIILKRIKK